MGNLATSISAYTLGIALAYFGIYASYYFSIVNELDDLKEIRNDKIKRMVNKIFIDSNTNEIDFLYLIDDFNKNNKVWLLDPDKKNVLFKISLVVYGAIAFIVSFCFLLGPTYLTKSSIVNSTTCELIMLGAYVVSLTWTIFHFYWDYVYLKPFKKAEKHMKKEIFMNLIVTEKIQKRISD